MEGAEPLVLEGMGRLLQETRPSLLLEILTQEAAELMNAQLAGLDYLYFDLNDDPKNGPFSVRSAKRLSKGACLNWLVIAPAVLERLGGEDALNELARQANS